jgi:hypothetical protein
MSSNILEKEHLFNNNSDKYAPIKENNLSSYDYLIREYNDKTVRRNYIKSYLRHFMDGLIIGYIGKKIYK